MYYSSRPVDFTSRTFFNFKMQSSHRTVPISLYTLGRADFCSCLCSRDFTKPFLPTNRPIRTGTNRQLRGEEQIKRTTREVALISNWLGNCRVGQFKRGDGDDFNWWRQWGDLSDWNGTIRKISYCGWMQYTVKHAVPPFRVYSADVNGDRERLKALFESWRQWGAFSKSGKQFLYVWRTYGRYHLRIIYRGFDLFHSAVKLTLTT